MKRGLSALMIVGALWLAGFLWFTHDARRPADTPALCDGIVALTGGLFRIDTSISLLKEGYGRQLLISGVAPHVTLKHLSQHQPDPLPPELKNQITLGKRAITTIGNAYETADWAHTNHFRRLLIVTAGYHIRRAMLELHRIAPDLVLVPYPVLPPALQAPLSRQTLFLLFKEYNKLLGAELATLTGLPDGRSGLTSP
ncbi:YdcF family protein [Gluconobacter morbifer]|uniref:DUF218 domain-containing protein n=1 Tax=Gluconobacter morbifer G707 TaxID=1088869 RepID=G6XKT9_9PROT|nr:YdcF family protein [Gluconobacter morbifer]EHH67652.1 hypothetical protein GMO_21050 [Gluconobacter morbifer G707]